MPSGRRDKRVALEVIELVRGNSALQVGDAADVGHVEAVVADAEPLALGQLDELDGPAAWSAVAVGHPAILPQVRKRPAPACPPARGWQPRSRRSSACLNDALTPARVHLARPGAPRATSHAATG